MTNGLIIIKLVQSERVINMSEKIFVKYHSEAVKPLEQHGDWVDLKTSEDLTAKEQQFVHVSLGISVALPAGFEAHILPRSSTFRKYGLILGNSQGIIDNAYSGEQDIWGADFFATKGIFVPAGTRLLQFRIEKTQNTAYGEIIFDDAFYPKTANRGGFGSTGD